ncbi:MAG: hypothetical protein FRX49_11347 [Trebouxia sp. A1-2]|nr:MAG: hypothetical protein FRX49_11347 [Trebouxia sp. A1-2]
MYTLSSNTQNSDAMAELVPGVQVIRHLNTKGAESSCNLQEAAGEYEVEIQQILQSTAEKVGAFNKQLALKQEESRIALVIKEMTARYEAGKAEANAKLQAQQIAAADAQAAITQAAQAKLNKLQLQAEGLREDLRRQLAEAGRLQQSAQAKGQRQEAALGQARQETLEAVQQGNQKYANMLAEHLGIEDELKHQLASKQQAALTRMQEHESERTHWEQEREALEEQVGAVRAEWQGKLEKALAEIHHHRQATAQKASLASAVQQQADQLQQSLEQGAAAREEAEATLAAAKLQTEGVRQDLAASQAHLTQTRKELHASQGKVDQLEQQCQELQDQTRQQIAEIKAKDMHVAYLERKEAQQELFYTTRLEQQATAAETATADLELQLATYREQTNRTQQQVDSLQSQLDHTQTQLQSAQQQNSRLLTDVVAAQREAGELSKQKKLAQTELRQLQEQVSEASGDEHQLEETAWEASLGREKRQAEALQQRLTAALQDSTSSHAALQTLQQQARQQAEAGKDMTASLQAELASATSNAHSLQQAAAGLTDQLTTARAEVLQLSDEVAMLQQQAKQNRQTSEMTLKAELSQKERSWKAAMQQAVAAAVADGSARDDALRSCLRAELEAAAQQERESLKRAGTAAMGSRV